MSLLTGDDFEDEEIEHEKVKQAFQQGKLFSNFQAEIFYTVGQVPGIPTRNSLGPRPGFHLRRLAYMAHFRNKSWNIKKIEKTS